MPTIPWSEVEKRMTPEQIARSQAKAEIMLTGILIAELRGESGLTQQQLADKLGVTQQAISKIESGSEIELSTLRRLLRVLGGKVVIEMPNRTIPLEPIAV